MAPCPLETSSYTPPHDRQIVNFDSVWDCQPLTRSPPKPSLIFRTCSIVRATPDSNRPRRVASPCRNQRAEDGLTTPTRSESCPKAYSTATVVRSAREAYISHSDMPRTANPDQTAARRTCIGTWRQEHCGPALYPLAPENPGRSRSRRYIYEPRSTRNASNLLLFCPHHDAASLQYLPYNPSPKNH